MGQPLCPSPSSRPAVPAYDWFTEGFETADPKHLKARLDGLERLVWVAAKGWSQLAERLLAHRVGFERRPEGSPEPGQPTPLTEVRQDRG